jgi:predicted nucleic acid-binding protein
MLYLLDTNVISELRKGTRCDPAVAAWERAELIPQGGAVSVITVVAAVCWPGSSRYRRYC